VSYDTSFELNRVILHEVLEFYKSRSETTTKVQQYKGHTSTSMTCILVFKALDPSWPPGLQVECWIT
jgi:hypothetical protein